MHALRHGPLVIHGLLPWSSNATFLGSIRAGDGETPVVYKPARGEQPLWDFPSGSLYRREVAAYELSRILGWPNVPPTVVREGPMGVGAVQLFVEHDPERHYLALDPVDAVQARRIAAFDVIVNNADRKSGHVLLGPDHRLWVIDHGITFHTEPKLRTVIWEFAREPVPPDVLADLTALADDLANPDGRLASTLGGLLDADEIEALAHRVQALVRTGRFPSTSAGRAVPWPPV